MASQWQRCEECRKIRPILDFSDDSSICQECRERAARPRPSTPAARSTVKVTRVAVPTTQPVTNGTLTGIGVPGRGDREVRVRRARLRALEQLATSHPEEFEELLAATRRDEGL